MNKCKQCGGQLSPKQKAFCSSICKAESQKNKPKPVFDETKQYRCLIDNKTFDLAVAASGYLKKYSKNTLKKEFSVDDWVIEDKPVTEERRWQCPHCTTSFKCENGRDSGGWIASHLKKVHNIDKTTHVENFPSDNVLWPHRLNTERQKKEIETNVDNQMTCLECGKVMAKISNSHLKTHGMTIEQYKDKHRINNLSSKVTRKKLSKLYFQNDALLELNYTSKGQAELTEYINSLGFESKVRRKDHVELDIFIESKQLAIEFNGLYWHSEYHGKKDSQYHISKTEYCEKNNIQLIHIFEDEWLNKKDIIKSRIKNLLGKTETIIYGRNCVVKEIDATTKNKFLNLNHIQGDDNSKYKFGLYHNDELVSVMTFRTPQISMGHKKSNTKLELSRFCTILNTNVLGGAGKLFKHAIGCMEFESIISYADRRWTYSNSETVYEQIGFKRVSVTKPNYWYMKRHTTRLPRYDFAKHKIIEMFTEADHTKSEWENMLMLGYDRIWDCGSLKFEYSK